MYAIRSYYVPLPTLSDEERAESLRATMARAPDHGEVWVFGYGSLMWNPSFSYVERRSGSYNFV